MATNVDVQGLSGIAGRVLTPGDDGYDEARRIHNGLIDRRPAVIVQCESAQDAAAAVRFARAAGIDITVRGGGHNVAGRCVIDDAVMIGNSLKSDVLPALEAGLWGVHIPYHITWAHERAEPPADSPRFARLDSIRELPGWLNGHG